MCWTLTWYSPLVFYWHVHMCHRVSVHMYIYAWICPTFLIMHYYKICMAPVFMIVHEAILVTTITLIIHISICIPKLNLRIFQHITWRVPTLPGTSYCGFHDSGSLETLVEVSMHKLLCTVFFLYLCSINIVRVSSCIACELNLIQNRYK